MTITQAIERFIQHLSVTRAKKTTISYTTSTNHFRTWATEQGIIRVADLTTQHLIDFAVWLKPAQQLKHGSFLTYLAGVNAFFEWLLDENLAEGYGEVEFLKLQRRLRKVRHKRVGRKIPKPPEDWKVQAILQAAYDRRQDTPRRKMKRLRDIALLETFRCTGARPDEILSLTRGDLNLTERSALVGTKGGDERPIIWDPRAWQALTAYLVNQGDHPDDTPIWQPHNMNHNGQVSKTGITYQALSHIFWKLNQEAGIMEGLTPRDFRKRFATGVLAASRNLAVTQEALGHKDPETTRIYAAVDYNDLADAVREAHKRGLV